MSDKLVYRRSGRRSSRSKGSPRSCPAPTSGDGGSLTDIAGTDGMTDNDTDGGMRSPASSNNLAVQSGNAHANKKYEKMKRRTKLAFLMLFFFCVIISLGHLWVVICTWGLQALAFRELTNLRYVAAKEQKLPWFRTFHWCLFLSATAFNKGRAVLTFLINTPLTIEYGWDTRLHLYKWFFENWDYVTFVLYVILFITFVLSLKRGLYKYQFSQLTWTVFSLAITMVQANGISDNILAGYFWFIFPAMLIACNDTMAYFSGVFFKGRCTKRIFLRLSPKKTWEGFIGGMLCTLFFSFYFSRAAGQSQFMYCPYTDSECAPPEVMIERAFELPGSLRQLLPFLPLEITLMPIQVHGLWLGLFSSLVAPFGGFFASGIKRAYKVKDFNTVIPGHGGIMDRIDCQFIMACYTRIHYVTFIRPLAVITVASVMTSIESMNAASQLELYKALQATLAAQGLIGNDGVCQT